MRTKSTNAPAPSAKLEAASELERATVELPLADAPEQSYIVAELGHIEVRLEGEQLAAFRRLHAGLQRARAQLRSGALVLEKSDVIRWLMEQVTDTR